jgi:hypothetical protein
LQQPTISSEVVWNDGVQGGATGGGVSEFFDINGTDPTVSHATYQAHTNAPLSPNTGFQGRALPDVAANADPNTGNREAVAKMEISEAFENLFYLLYSIQQTWRSLRRPFSMLSIVLVIVLVWSDCSSLCPAMAELRPQLYKKPKFCSGWLTQSKVKYGND